MQENLKPGETLLLKTVFIVLAIYLYAEAPVTFSLPLLNQQVSELEPISMTCQLNKPGQKISWYKDDVPIKPRKGKYEISSEDKSYTLFIPKSIVEDTAIYKAKVGNQESTCQIVVYGEQNMPY